MPQVLTDVTRVVPYPIGQIWGIVTIFGAEVLWFKNVRASSLEGYGIGSVRTIYFKKSPWLDVVREQMTICDGDSHHIQWKVYNEHVTDDIFANIVLEKVGEDSTKIHWFAEGEPFPDEVARADLKAVIEDMYNSCISSAVAKLAEAAKASA